MNLAVDRGSVPMNIGALLSFDPAGQRPAAELAAVIGARIVRVPRLGQRLVRTPPGCGRPVWVDDPGLTLERHLDVSPLPTPTDGDGPDDPALRSAVDLLLHRLPPDRPLWRARVLRSRAGLATHLVIVMHHALADGMGGLAVLAALADGSAPGPAGAAGSRPMPAARELARDAWAERVEGLTAAPDHARRLVSGLRELGAPAE